MPYYYVCVSTHIQSKPHRGSPHIVMFANTICHICKHKFPFHKSSAIRSRCWSRKQQNATTQFRRRVGWGKNKTDTPNSREWDCDTKTKCQKIKIPETYNEISNQKEIFWKRQWLTNSACEFKQHENNSHVTNSQFEFQCIRHTE